MQFGHYGHACYGGEGESWLGLGGRVEGHGWAGMRTLSLSTGQLLLRACRAAHAVGWRRHLPSAGALKAERFLFTCPQAAAPPSPTCWSSLWAASPLVSVLPLAGEVACCLSAARRCSMLLEFALAFCLLSWPFVFPTPRIPNPASVLIPLSLLAPLQPCPPCCP